MTIATIRPGINTPNTGGLLDNLSDGEKKDLFNDLNAPDLQLLLQRQKKLFEDIKIFQKDHGNDPFDHIELLTLLSRLFEHSIEDGMKLAEQLKITPGEYMEIIRNERFFIKHEKVYKKMRGHQNGPTYSKINKKTVKLLDDMYISYVDRIHDLNGNVVNNIPPHTSPSSTTTLKIMNEMDDIYSQYLRIQKFKIENPNDPRTAGERLAEDMFENIKNTGKYYKTRVVEAIYDNLVKNILPAKDDFYYSKEKKVYDFFDKVGILYLGAKVHEFMYPENIAIIINGIKANHLNLNYDEKAVAEKIQKDLKDAIYKPLGTIFHMKNHLAEKQNKAELEQMLQQHFGDEREKKVTLAYDKKKGTYTIEQMQQQGGQNEKAVVEESIDHSGLKQVGDPIIINGSIFFKGEQYNGGTRDMIKNGVRMGAGRFDEIGDYMGLYGKLYFSGKKGGSWAIYDEGGTPIDTFPRDTKIQNIIAINGSLAVHTIEKDGEYIFYPGKKIGPYKHIGDIHVVDKELTYVTSNDFKNYYLHKGNSSLGPYATIHYQEDRDDTNDLWLARKGDHHSAYKNYGINRNLGEKEGRVTDIMGLKKAKPFDIGIDTKTKKFMVCNLKDERLSDEYDLLYGPREQNGQTIFIGKKDKEFQKLVINATGAITPITDEENKKLELLNLCIPLTEQQCDLGAYKRMIEKYLVGKSKIKAERNKTGIQKLKNNIQQSGGALSYFNKMIKQLPQLFIDTLPAKKDKNEELLAENICRKIFPEAFIEDEKSDAFYRGISGKRGNENQQGHYNSPADYLSDKNTDAMEGGDPTAELAPDGSDTIMQIRGTLDDIITTNISGAYNEEYHAREKVYFSLQQDITGPKKTTTITLPNIKYDTSLILPKTINANILPERVKGITSDGKEIDLKISTNALNISSVSVENKSIKEIVYSIEQPLLSPKIQDINTKQYEQFKHQFIRIHGEENIKSGKRTTTRLLDQVAQLDEEELLFLENIKNDAPKQQLIKIEQYVRTHSYYDMKNKEVVSLKNGKSIDEKMYICKQRIDELKDKNPELAAQVEDKKRAGVCADFATITIALLRKAGFLSGVISGFLASTSTVTKNDAHGVAYVVFPDEKGNNQIIIVDGTPHGGGSDRPSLQEQEIIRAQQEDEMEEKMEAMFEKISKALESGDKAAIDKMLEESFNGNLEDLLNVVLKKEVRISHYKHLQNLLDVYRYSPLKNSDIASPENQAFIKKEMQREDASSIKDYKQEAKAGTLLFDMTHQFINRFSKNDGGDKYQGLDRLDTIIDTCKDLLNAIEYKSIKIIIKYLRAEKIQKK